MNQKVYKKICCKVGHDWAFKDENEWILKKCLNCGIEQYFIPCGEAEVISDADMDADDPKKE